MEVTTKKIKQAAAQRIALGMDPFIVYFWEGHCPAICCADDEFYWDSSNAEFDAAKQRVIDRLKEAGVWPKSLV